MFLRLALLLPIVATPATAEQVVPLDVSGPRPTAQLVIAEHPPVNVIFDTGAGGSVLNSELGRTHRLPNEGNIHIGSPGSLNQIPAYLTTLPKARLGTADITGQRAVVGDLGVPLPGISGVMSPNLFHGSLVRFELKRSRVVVVPKNAATTPAGTAYAYSGRHPLPSADIDIAGVKMSAVLDTGSARGFSLPLEIADRFPLKAPMAPTKPAKMAGGERKAFLAQIDGTVRVGPIVLNDPPVTFIERFEHANVGFSILKDWTVVIDPAERQSWIVVSD
jgi:hypothetical protein